MDYICIPQIFESQGKKIHSKNKPTNNNNNNKKLHINKNICWVPILVANPSPGEFYPLPPKPK